MSDAAQYQENTAPIQTPEGLSRAKAEQETKGNQQGGAGAVVQWLRYLIPARADRAGSSNGAVGGEGDGIRGSANLLCR